MMCYTGKDIISIRGNSISVGEDVDVLKILHNENSTSTSFLKDYMITTCNNALKIFARYRLCWTIKHYYMDSHIDENISLYVPYSSKRYSCSVDDLDYKSIHEHISLIGRLIKSTPKQYFVGIQYKWVDMPINIFISDYILIVNKK